MATATVEYVTVQSSDPCEFVARTVIVPELTAVGVPLITLEPVLKAMPAGSAPTAAYVGAGLPSASGTVTEVMAVPTVQDWASPVLSLKDGATKAAAVV